MKTCLHRFTGDCPTCKRDYSRNKPNNNDCPRYYEIKFSTLTIEKDYEKKLDKMYEYFLNEFNGDSKKRLFGLLGYKKPTHKSI